MREEERERGRKRKFWYVWIFRTLKIKWFNMLAQSAVKEIRRDPDVNFVQLVTFLFKKRIYNIYYYKALHDRVSVSSLPPPLSPLLNLLLLHYPHYFSTDMPKILLPQGLCTCRFLYQNHSTLDRHSLIDFPLNVCSSAIWILSYKITTPPVLVPNTHWHILIFCTSLLWFKFTFFFWRRYS